MCLTRHLVLFHILFFICRSRGGLLDYTSLMRSYYLLCGPEYFCLPSNITHRWAIKPNMSYRHMNVCPECKCDAACIKRGDCCADLYFSFPDLDCVNRTIIQGRYDKNKTEQFSALMVTSCPAESNDVIKEKCVSLNDTKSRLRNFPVSGWRTPITFYNKYCAECHNVHNYSFWTLDIDCFHLTDFNYLSTLDDVIDTAFDGECIFQAFREDDASVELKQENCFDIDEGETLFTKCNQTGEWLDYDSNIVYACESFFKGKYRLFKNIFCYICNPSLQNLVKDMSSGCNATGQWHTYDGGLQRACADLPTTLTTFPFKNIFCYLCNRGNDSSQIFVDIIGQLVEIPIDGTYFHYQYDLDINNFNSNFFLHTIQKKIEKDASLSDVIHNSYDVYMFRTNDGTIINVTNLLLQKTALGGGRACKSRRFLYREGHDSPCSCEISSLFDPHSHRYCDDLFLQMPMHCRNTLYNNPLQKTRKLHGVPTVNGCFMEEPRKVLQKGCSIPQSSDIFSLIPLSKENGINYDNFYCVLCNFGSEELIRKMDGDFSNITFTHKISPNRDFIYLDRYLKSQNLFTIWGNIEILCPNYLDYSHYLMAGELVDKAKGMQCRIQFKKDISKLRRCLLGKALKRCADDEWTYSDNDVKWACKNLTNYKEYEALLPKIPSSLKSRYDLSERKIYRGAYKYTNVYCSLCKPKRSFPEYFINNCTIHEYSESCYHYPRIYFYYPFKNYYCARCNNIGIGGWAGIDSEGTLDKFKRVVGINWFPILRNLFSISGDIADHENTTINQCKSDQAYDEYKDICRNITCYSGKNLNGKDCTPLLERTMNLQYSMTIQTDLSGKDDQFLNTLSKSVTENLIEKIENHFDDLLDYKPDVRIESMVILDGEGGEKQHSQCRLTRVKLFFQSSGSRLRIEKSLIELKLSFGNSCNRKNPWSNDAIHYDVASRRRIRKRFVSGAFSDGYFSAKVSNVLLCPQIELDEDEYNVSDDGSILTLTREGFESVSFDEFATTPSGQMRVCLNYLRKIKYMPMSMTDGAVEVDLKQKYLWIMSLVSSALSVVSLTLGLTVYFCVPNLRSIPGKIIMLLMTSLLFALVFHQVSYFAVNNKSGCIAVAIVLHMSWLSVFLCTQTANFHMWRTFTSMEVGSRSERILLKYVMYIYGLPVCLVCVVLATGLAMHSDVWWGYGGSKCFIIDINLLIGLFICPVALICVLNILFFTLTFRAITRSPTAENNKRKRNELAIFARLTTVTGVSWLLQIIDSFLPFTYFTFISTIINSLQGLSIFVAFIVNKRVWGLLLERFNPSDNANSSKTTRHTT